MNISNFSRLGSTAVAAFALVATVTAFAHNAIGQTTASPSGSHMTVANPASLSGPRAETVYEAIRNQLRQNYGSAGDPVTSEYQSWKRYNSAPYRSAVHGERFLNNYANRLASSYGRYEKLGVMPPGAMIAKDSFTVTEKGHVMTGPFFLMEKKAAGFNPASGDWLYMMIRPGGGLLGITRGRGSENVKFCADCHNTAPPGQDRLFLMPKKVRR